VNYKRKKTKKEKVIIVIIEYPYFHYAMLKDGMLIPNLHKALLVGGNAIKTTILTKF